MTSIFPYRQSSIQSKVGSCKVVVLIWKAPPVTNLDGSDGGEGKLHIKLLLGSDTGEGQLHIIQLPINETIYKETMDWNSL